MIVLLNFGDGSKITRSCSNSRFFDQSSWHLHLFSDCLFTATFWTRYRRNAVAMSVRLDPRGADIYTVTLSEASSTGDFFLLECTLCHWQCVLGVFIFIVTAFFLLLLDEISQKRSSHGCASRASRDRHLHCYFDGWLCANIQSGSPWTSAVYNVAPIRLLRAAGAVWTVGAAVNTRTQVVRWLLPSA